MKKVDRLIEHFPCPVCGELFATRRNLSIHYHRWCILRIDDGSDNTEDDDLLVHGRAVGFDEEDDDDDENFQHGTVEVCNGLPQKVSIPLTQWNELWLLKFCLTHNLSKEAQDDLRSWVINVSLFF